MSPRAAERLLAAVLWCYPPAFRRAHGEEVRQFIRTALVRDRTPAGRLAGDLLRGLGREWLAAAPLTPRGEPMRNLIRDIRHAGRMLGKAPAFTAAAIVTLALGIGANTALFTLADATLLRPVHVRAPHELVVWSWTSAYPDYQEYAKRTDIFQGVVALSGQSRISVNAGDSVGLAQAMFVSGNTFDVLGVGPALGRLLVPSDDIRNGPIVAVLGHDYWRSRFGSDPTVVGRTVRLNERPATIVGVAERGFRGISVGANPDLYLPTATVSQVRTGFFARFDPTSTRNFVWLNVIGRLRDDVSPQQAADAMTALYGELQGPPRPGRPREALRWVPLPVRALGNSASDVRAFVAALVGVVALTLLVGCANLANLLLAKAAARRREIGVRLALGATRARVVQQLLAESVLLAVCGGLAGLAVARWTLALLGSFELPGGIEIGRLALDLDGRALAVTFGLSLLTGAVFGALPAWRASRTDLLGSLREHSRATMPGGFARNALLAVQVALTVVLVAGSALFGRALMAALDTNPGFDPRGVVTASVNLGLARYEEGAAGGFYRTALERVQALPDVTSAAWTNLIPTRGLFMGVADIEGYAKAADEDVTIYGAHVGPGYFRTIGTRVLSGSEFTSAHGAAAPRVGIVNDTMARTYWPGRSALGGRVKMFDEWITIVGIVETTVVSELREPPRPHIYFPFEQWLAGPMAIALDPAHLVVRTTAPLERVMPLVRDRLRSVDPNVPLYDVESFEARAAGLVMPQRMGVALFTLFSALALALAIVGIYGVASYVAAMRTREIGLRIALGATRSSVRRLVLRQGIPPVAFGIAAGVALALYAGRLVQGFLHGVSRFDPLTFTAVPVVLAAVALAATYFPARRASRIEPVQALRDQ